MDQHVLPGCADLHAGRHVHPAIGIQAAFVGLLGDLHVPGMLSNDCGDPRMFTHGPGNFAVRLISRHARSVIARNEGQSPCCSPFWDDFYAKRRAQK